MDTGPMTAMELPNGNEFPPLRTYTAIACRTGRRRFWQKHLATAAEQRRPLFLHHGGNCRVPGGIPVPIGLREEFPNRYRLGVKRDLPILKPPGPATSTSTSTARSWRTQRGRGRPAKNSFAPYWVVASRFIAAPRKFAIFSATIPLCATTSTSRKRLWPKSGTRKNIPRNTSAEPPGNFPRRTVNATTNKTDTYTYTYTYETMDRCVSLLPGTGTGRVVREGHELLGLPLPKSLAWNYALLRICATGSSSSSSSIAL
mmetsp:Transcript_19162/g.40159  ORF Transcript_19162/g.40159 Transcript_19162/m.40159 type:complete len:258 (+) Transcript_19162:154-927(+)